MHCKSLWIKASAKCINVNVNVMIKWSLTVQMNRSLHVGLKITLLNIVLSYGAIEIEVCILSYCALMCLTVLFVNLSVYHRIVKRNRANVSAEMIQVIFM